ncbi:hypothetical protein Lysil_0670 [Lysobacter silvestris]|uniref:Uncharacterized protein n=1 Tax=Solilutibacter silvestris TaxID=1645665 RepID=A0A2K1Q222_9GAMM|nr:hypothetical protein Lysil_0670 [Lysobacter silvestris]
MRGCSFVETDRQRVRMHAGGEQRFAQECRDIPRGAATQIVATNVLQPHPIGFRCGSHVRQRAQFSVGAIAGVAEDQRQAAIAAQTLRDLQQSVQAIGIVGVIEQYIDITQSPALQASGIV